MGGVRGPVTFELDAVQPAKLIENAADLAAWIREVAEQRRDRVGPKAPPARGLGN